MSNRADKERIEVALRDNSPSTALGALARALKAEGMAQRDMYQLFDEYRAKHEQDADETAYNAILDTMDRIMGWCGPHARLFDTVLPP